MDGSCDEIKSDKLVINHMDEIKDTMLKNNLVREREMRDDKIYVIFQDHIIYHISS